MATAISTPALRKEFAVAPINAAIVRDAVGRWKKKGGGYSSMESRIPIVVQVHAQRCVVLYLRAPNIGGNPVYCYLRDKDQLVSAEDSVE